MKKIFLFVVLMNISLFAATGDIVSVTVDSSGYRIAIEIDGIDTGSLGSYNFRLGGKNGIL